MNNTGWAKKLSMVILGSSKASSICTGRCQKSV